MFESEKDLIKAVQKTRVARKPLQYLDTFATTIINYYVITEPIYSDIDEMLNSTLKTDEE